MNSWPNDSAVCLLPPLCQWGALSKTHRRTLIMESWSTTKASEHGMHLWTWKDSIWAVASSGLIGLLDGAPLGSHFFDGLCSPYFSVLMACSTNTMHRAFLSTYAACGSNGTGGNSTSLRWMCVFHRTCSPDIVRKGKHISGTVLRITAEYVCSYISIPNTRTTDDLCSGWVNRRLDLIIQIK